jgi:hypothetical protein
VLAHNDKQAFQQLFLRKAECWEYEEEHRMMFPHRGGGIAQRFPPGSIRRLILGCAMPPFHRQSLARWLIANAPDVQVAFAGPVNDASYELAIGDLSVQELL